MRSLMKVDINGDDPAALHNLFRARGPTYPELSTGKIRSWLVFWGRSRYLWRSIFIALNTLTTAHYDSERYAWLQLRQQYHNTLCKSRQNVALSCIIRVGRCPDRIICDTAYLRISRDQIIGGLCIYIYIRAHRRVNLIGPSSSAHKYSC